ncbi:GNAT family N-acetyltransferase [Microbacterium sp.]|uniref:GNAT family N-acetyltransferase n=1 Tax=Microbacterium sp. TaxID=51671 RepID=UPI003A8FFA88
MSPVDARTVPVDPESEARLRASGFDYRVVDMDDDALAVSFARAAERGFLGSAPTDAEIVPMREAWRERRSIGVYEQDAASDALPVATVNSWVAPMSVPGGAVPMWSISMVTVAGTHRRRGIARNLLEGELRSAVAAGVPLAGLTVSEATIYGRYGFGSAVPVARIAIDTARAGWRPAEVPGRVEYVEPVAVAREFQIVHERARLGRAGQVPGWPRRWMGLAGLGGDEEKKDASVRGVRYVDAGGEVRGAMAHSFKDAPAPFRSILRIRHLEAETDDALRALWGFAVNHDLVDRVEADLRPVDDPIAHLVADQRAVELTVHDHGWLRVLDVPAALQTRTYSAPADIVVRVDDSYGFADGTWRVRIDVSGAAAVEPVDAAPDVVLGVAELSAIYAGGVPLTQLSAAGRVQGTASAVHALSAAFRTDPAPTLGIWY